MSFKFFQPKEEINLRDYCYSILHNGSTASVYTNNTYFQHPLFEESSSLYTWDKNHSILLEDYTHECIHIKELQSMLDNYYQSCVNEDPATSKETNEIATIVEYTKRLHPLLKINTLCFNYLCHMMYQAFKQTKLRRLYGFITATQSINSCDVQCDIISKKFVNHSKSCFSNILTPLCLYFCNEENMSINIKSQISHYYNSSLYSIDKDDICRVITPGWYESLNAKTYKYTFLETLNSIYDLLYEYCEYCDIINSSKKSYPNVSNSQFLLLFMSHNDNIMNLLSGCYQLNDYYLYREICIYYIHKAHLDEINAEKNSPLPPEARAKTYRQYTYIGSHNEIFDYYSDDLYEDLLENYISLEVNQNIIDMINKYFPLSASKHMSDTIIMADTVEQVLLLEILDIIKSDIPIHKCEKDKCNRYFLSKDKRRKFCDKHKCTR